MRVSFRELSRLSGIHPGVIRFRACELGIFHPEAMSSKTRDADTLDSAAGWEVINAIQSDTDFRETAIRAAKAFRSKSK